MQKLLEFPTSYENIIIKLNYYMEAWPNNSYDGDDTYYGKQICYMHIENKVTKHWIKTWYKTNVIVGKGFAEQRDKFVLEAKAWLVEYHYNALYHKKPPMCNHIGNRRLMCPNVDINDQSQAGCGISPNHWGYGGSFMARPLPKDLECDVYKIMSPGTKFTWDIPGSNLSLLEFWKCYTGEAKKELEAT